MKHLLAYGQINESESVPLVWYHGTNVLFDKFDKSFMTRNFKSSSLGLYFTEYLKPLPYGTSAREYANDAVSKHGGMAVVYKCSLRMNKPLEVDSNGWESSVHCLDMQRTDIKTWVADGGHDAVICYDFNSGSDYAAVVFEPEQIRIIEVLTGEVLKGINY